MYYHRLQVPFARMANIYNVEINQTTDRIIDVDNQKLKQYDAVVFSRCIETNGTNQQTINKLRRLGIKIIFDIDDYWHLENTHHLFSQYKEAKISQQTIEAMSVADLVFTPTPYLTGATRKHTDKSYTIKTCVNERESQWQSTPTDSNLTRFGWIGGIHHLTDINLLEKSISKVHQKLLGYQLCVGGFSSYNTTAGMANKEYVDIEKVFTSNYTSTDSFYKDFLYQYSPTLPDHLSYFKNYRRLWSKDINNYGRLYDEIDIALVPLNSSGLFNQYKSELKLIEAGTKGKMAIVSKVKPYTIIPDECVHFIEPGDINGWYKAIKYCLENPSYVKEKAQALQNYIKENYKLDEQNELRYNLIKNCLNG